jgi:hypothetical protein
MLKQREEIDESYIRIYGEDQQKKADRKVIESRKKLSDEEVKKIIMDMLSKKTPLIKIKVHLQEEKEIPESRVNEILVDIVRVNEFINQ